jgi:NAD(P)-dependent dehydrogenase (short-subunit alcohol dehydrogenase family)
VPNLRPPLNICKPTGVKLGAGSRVVVMPDKNDAAVALAGQLQKLGVEVLLIEGAPDADTLTSRLDNWLAAGPVQGVYWLPALDDEGSLDNMNLAAWREALRTRVKLFYTTMRILFEQIAAPGTFLVSATRLGGQHGYNATGATAPLGGAVVGFTKTYNRERPETLVKAVDFEAGLTPSEIAQCLIEETLRDPGAVEIGYKAGERWTITLQEQPAVDGHAGITLNEDSVFLITGAAGSIVSAITADLATASGGTFYLLDLVPEPDPNNPDLKRFVSDKDGLKRDLFARIQARGERATPALVEKELAGLERAQAAQSAIDAVRAAGGTAHYFSVNLADGEAIAKVIDQVRKQSGRIDVLLHAAGIERSHFLPDKDQREFDLVFDVKSDGWFNLLHAIGNMPLRATVAFSSIAGRFGNGGQTDYSAANDLLCKITSSFRTTRPATRGIVIDWTAWGGIGMATRGSIPKMMEAAGIDMLPPEAGIPLIRRELTAGATCGEIVIGNRLGILLNEGDPTGGLDTEALNASRERAAAHGPMVGKITGMGIHSGLTMETTLDPTAQPFLYDHRIDGTPVLPGVMGIEAFAEAALCVHPGWRVGAIEEVNFLAPFKFYKDEPRTVIIQAGFYPQGDSLVADCRLIGRRILPNHPQPQETTHFTACVRLTKQAPQVSPVTPLRLSTESIIDSAAIYRIYFHGPAYQVVERAWWDGKRMVGEMTKNLPGNHKPSELPTLMAPRLIELCFQTAGLWEMGVHNRMGLPLHVEQVCWSRSPQLAEGPLYAIVTPDERQESFNAEVVDTAGNHYLQVSGYRTVALPNSVDVEPLHAMRPVLA